MTDGRQGISFPIGPDGRRSTTATAKAVMADALRPVDHIGAESVEREIGWRSQYLVHFRRQTEAGLSSASDWRTMAMAGLESAHSRMVVTCDGQDRPLRCLLEDAATRTFHTATVRGTGRREEQLTVPYRGKNLTGQALHEQVDRWLGDGVMEPSAAEAVKAVIDNPAWLSLPGSVVAVLGAGAEMGPLPTLLRWGATVAGVDLPRPVLWQKVLETAHNSAGTLHLPVSNDIPDADEGVASIAGADLLAEVPAVADWLAGLDGRLVLGNYLYADGGAHVLVSVAADVLVQRLQRARPDLALAYLATPTDVFAVPRSAVEHASAAYDHRSRPARLVRRPLRWASRGQLLQRAYLPEADPGICDSLVTVQGPNYAFAKRIQRWRATVARDAGTTVSFHVAPSSRTRSVVKNRALAAAFAGAHRFGVEIFAPDTANTLMAALLVYDLNTTTTAQDHPWQDEAQGAVHGGLWRAAYAPRSALGFAALWGYATSR